MKECDILAGGGQNTLTPPTYFQRVKTLPTPRIYAPDNGVEQSRQRLLTGVICCNRQLKPAVQLADIPSPE